MSDFAKDEVRTFTAASLREALAQVRSELGVDALILGQQQVGHRVSVRACLELPGVVVELDDAELSRGATELSRGATELPRHATAPPMPHAVPVDAADDAGPEQAQLGQTFIQAGYDADIVADMPGCANLDEFRRTIANRLNYAHRSIHGLRGCYRFIGASGVGKSATLIKVLVEWVLRNHARDVVVISTDNERLAGTEALQLTCQMLSVPMRECSAADLPGALAQLSGKALVLVDSPALELQRSPTAVNGLQDIWVCSALHGAANLLAQHAVVRALRPVGVVVTQLDQLMAPDPLANLLYRWRLPLCWLGTSSRLPDGIDLAEEESVRHNLFGAALPVTLDLAV